MKLEIKKRIEQIKKGEVPQGYKITKIGIVPNEWEEKKLGEIGIFKKGKGISSSLIIDKGLPAMMYGDIYVKYNIKFHSVDYRISEETAQKSTPIYNNDLLFTCSGETALEIGKCICYLGKETVYIGGDILALTPVKYNGLFLAYQQNIYESVKQKARLGQGHSIVHIYQNSLEKLCICSPILQEQQKIVKILSVQDKVIELKVQLIKEKQKQKKYLMQNLLTGKIRLKGFKGEWKKVKLGEICDVVKGEQINKSTLSKAGKYYVLNGGITSSGYTDVWNTYENTISISEGGNSCGFVNFNREKFWSGGHCYTLQKINTDLIKKEFLYCYLKHHENDLMNLRVGSGLPNIQKSSLYSFYVILPSLEEQEIIAKILSTQDKEIELLKKKLEQEKQKKKALMQLLLTGIVRV